MKKIITAMIPLFIVPALSAHAEVGTWDAELAVGFVNTSGNTDTSTLNVRGDVEHDRARWRHAARAEALRTTNEGDDTAERYFLSGKSDYKFNGDTNYVFGMLAYEDDRFSGYDYRFSQNVGYGRRVVHRPAVKLDLEAGVGARQSRLETTGERESEGIVRVAGMFEWQIADNALFTQDVDSEIGEESTITRSTTALATQIVGNLAAKVSLRMRYNSDVPPGFEQRDTETTVSLVYKFF